MDNYTFYTSLIPPALRHLPWRAHPLDGKLLLFERDTGLNALLEGEETAHLQRHAPRTLLIAVTNACNMTCHFCYRDLNARSGWRYDTLLEFCQQADEWGVLEVAFGGGEPMLFPRWPQFVHDLYDTTGLCINFTTNGLLLTEDFLGDIAGKYGNIRLSLYDDNHPDETIKLLVGCGARFGVNWLVTPDALPGIERRFLQLLDLGVCDFLLLSYKGHDPALHLTPTQGGELAEFINRMYGSLNGLAQIKLDVCWGDWLPDVPQLFDLYDCGAGDDFLSITSDKQVKICSFQPAGLPVETLADVRRIWEQRRKRRTPVAIGGCARLPERGLSGATIGPVVN